MDKIRELNWAVAEVLDRLRNKAGLTQEQLAGLAGLSPEYISALERGAQAGSLTAMVHLASALKIDAAELVRQIEQVMRGNPKPPSRMAGKPGKKKKI